MKDGVILLLTGVLCAAGAALFFRFFGNEAFSVLSLVMLIGALADNVRLRRRVRAMGAKPEGKRTWL